MWVRIGYGAAQVGDLRLLPLPVMFVSTSTSGRRLPITWLQSLVAVAVSNIAFGSTPNTSARFFRIYCVLLYPRRSVIVLRSPGGRFYCAKLTIHVRLDPSWSDIDQSLIDVTFVIYSLYSRASRGRFETSAATGAGRLTETETPILLAQAKYTSKTGISY